MNGTVNVSIGDGWWAEGYTGDNGWLIDAGDAGDSDAQDAADAARIYDLLEQEVVPTFFDRDKGIPRRWLSYVRQAIVTVAPRFSARRMVKDYVETMYAPALRRRAGVER